MNIQRLRPAAALGLMTLISLLSGCAVTRSAQPSGMPVIITDGTFAAISAGSAPVVLTANQAVTWALTLANQPCSPDCGTLSESGSASLTATYTPPAKVPSNGSASIIATAVNDNTRQYVLSFRIVGPIQVSITSSKFQSVFAGSAPITITATIANDLASKGLAWTLTAGGSDCSPSCGSLSVSPAPALTMIYTPPPTAPSGAADSPTIQVSSVTDTHASDSISFSIQHSIDVAITSTKFSTVLFGSAPVTVTASISHDPSNAGVTWSLSAGGSDCSPACGRLVATGLTAVYTPPATLPIGTADGPEIIVSSVTNPSSTDFFSFFITAKITVNITSTKFTTASAGGASVTVSASILNDNAAKGLNWTLTAGGSPCSPACGAIVGQSTSSPSGGGAFTYNALYTPPTTLPSGAADSPTISVSSVSDSSATDSFSFTIVSASNLLNGNYAFLMRGYDIGTPSSPMAMAGTLSMDGSGNIIAGEIDINDDGGTLFVPGPLTGTYTTDLSFQNETRGIITITNFTFPGSTTGLAFRFVLSADGTRGRIIEMDGAGYREAGTFQKQDSAALIAANPSGSYAFGLDADVPAGLGGRAAEAGQFVLGPTGNVVSGLADLSKAAGLNPIFTNQPLDVTAGTAPDASGRGQLTLSLQGNQAQYAYYIVNSGQLNLIEIDHGWTYTTVQAGTARLQQNLTAESVNMTSVLQMTGIDVSAGAPNAPSCAPQQPETLGPHVLVGLITISGGNTLAIDFEYNDLGCVGHGAIPDPNLMSSAGQVAFDPATGRGTITIDHGYDQAFVNQAVFYLYGPGEGFIIDADPSPVTAPPSLAVTNQGYSGTLVPQQGDPTQFTVPGNMIVFSGSSSVPDIPEAVGAANVNSTDSSMSFALNLTSVSQGNFPDLSLPTGFIFGSPNANGSGRLSVPQALFGEIANGYLPQFGSYYAITQNQFVMVGVQSGQASGVTFFDAP